MRDTVREGDEIDPPCELIGTAWNPEKSGAAVKLAKKPSVTWMRSETGWWAHTRQLFSGAGRGRFGSSAGMFFLFSGEPVADLNISALWGAASAEQVDELLGHTDTLDTMVVVSETRVQLLGPPLDEAGLTSTGASPLASGRPSACGRWAPPSAFRAKAPGGRYSAP